MNKKLTLGMLAVLALTACTEKEFDHSNLSDKSITFSATVADDWNTTRSAMQQNAAAQVQQLQEGLYLHTVVSPGFEGDREGRTVTRGGKYEGVGEEGSKTLSTSETFYVSGYRYGAGESVSNVTSANFMFNAPVTYNNGWWRSSETYYMPADGDKIDFFAYFTPTGTTGVTPIDAEGGLQVRYEVPLGSTAEENTTKVTTQPDLLAAATAGETYNAEADHTVDLGFQHQLTCVNFVMDDNVAPGTITEIAFLNVYMSATLKVGGTWDTTNGNKPGETPFKVNFQTVDSENQLQTGDNRKILSSLLMIPQTFTDATQKLRVTINIDGEEKELFATLTERWLPNTTVTYKISTSAVNTLRIGTVTYPTSWSAASDECADIKTAYATNDALGVYAIDAEGNVVLENGRLTKTASGWSGNALYTPACTYFAYYPYQEGGLAHSGLKNGSVVTTAADFFADAIAAWAPADDQSTATLLNAQDLQVGTASIISASTIDLTMTHAMGLTSLTLESKSVPTTRYFYVGSDGAVSTTSFINSNETTDVVADGEFELKNNMLANSNSTVFYYVMKPNTEQEVSNTETGIGKWVTSSVTLTAAENEYNPLTAHCRSYVYRGWAYEYQGKGQPFTVPVEGSYRIECWGAGAFTHPYTNVYINGGGYTAGDITLEKDVTLYVFVGQRTQNSTSYTFNGGGYSQTVGGSTGPTGCGATDIRLNVTSNLATWSDFNSLLSRIMVAGGAGHSGGDVNSSGDIHSCAGGLTGYDAVAYVYRSYGHIGGYGGTQTAGGAQGTQWHSAPQNGGVGYFGYGGFGGKSSNEGAGSGGGGGYYGGSGGTGANSGAFPGGGGSSYISGHAGCNSVSSAADGATSSNRKHRGAGTIHYSGYVFTNIRMVDGAGFLWPANSTSKGSRVNQPNPRGGADQIGHNGNGFCRIAATFVE